ncbi:MAG: hypothetical protein LBN92_06525, partial [Treponema sp.]|nr:hypothetical protein [Treponema sp.]
MAGNGLLMKKLWTVVGILVLCAGMGWGADYTWIGGSGTWNISGNWLPSGVPVSGDTVTIPSTGSVTLDV